MGSTENGGPRQTGGQRSLFENVGRDPDPEKAERGLSANPKVPSQEEDSSVPSPVVDGTDLRPLAVTPDYVEPIWLQRIKLMILVTFSVWVGMLLVVLPWTPVWGHNNFLLAHPDFRVVFQHYFTRGAASGLGLIDVWIGIVAAVKYHDKK
jgi:hypothetical protein